MILRAIYCPGCGAPVDPGENTRVTCSYCGSVLEVRQRKVVQTEGSDAQADALHIDDLPLASLMSTETGRFELSVLEQDVPGSLPDGFFPLPLPEGRFALAYLRLVDEKGQTRPGDLEGLSALVRTSLEDEEDPGLAAYQALEHLSQGAFDGLLEIAILLFAPARSSVVVYNAGCQSSIWWVSSEEGRVIDKFRSYPALEKKMLRQSNDHFSNSDPCFLAADDLVVLVSAAYAGRGGNGHTMGTHYLLNSLNKNLGEHPLRVVTLAKNSFWEGLNSSNRDKPLSGPLRVAAVRAMTPAVPELPAPLKEIRLFESGDFDLALHASEGDSVVLHPLHDERSCLIWIEAADLQPGEVEGMSEAILAVLDRRDHGDNENPREAGRQGLARLGRPCRLLVLQLLLRWGRAKWFRAGWQQPLCLGPRGFSDPASAQIFDEGGEASVYERSRMLFLGNLPLKGPAPLAPDLAQQWYGGKASALYAALFAHWRTSKSDRALEKLLRAAHADLPNADLGGIALLTRKGG